MYTHLYFIVLTRLSRCDLTTFKISSMSFRLMQVCDTAHTGSENLFLTTTLSYIQLKYKIHQIEFKSKMINSYD